MQRTRFNRAECPIARSVDLIGDWWTPIIMREAFLGRRRFDDFQSSLSLSRGILAKRLARLVDEGLLAKRRYEERPPRYEYVLTDKGRDFYPVLAAMWRWGSDWLWQKGSRSPFELYDKDTRRPIRPRVVDENTGEPVDVRKVRVGLRRSRSSRRRAARDP